MSFNPDDTFNQFDARYLLREAWRDWTPTVTQSGSVTVTVTYARYIVLARTVITQAQLSITGSGTGNNAIVIGGVPSVIQPANNSGNTAVIGSALVFESGVGFWGGALVAFGASDWRITHGGNTSWVGITPNFGLSASDTIGFMATYER